MFKGMTEIFPNFLNISQALLMCLLIKKWTGITNSYLQYIFSYRIRVKLTIFQLHSTKSNNEVNILS